MNLYIPTLIYSEKDCVKNHSRELAAAGNKAFIITGRHSSRANGSLKAVTDVLDTEGRKYVIFDDIEENPSVETVMRARDIGINGQVDYVIGIGGGSPLDACKAIAMMIANPKENEKVLYESKPLRALPVITVPTTAGTGSEVTPYSILTLHESRTKKSISHRIYPVMALIDYTYLKTQSNNVLINTAVDALAHLIESYLNTNSNELNRVYSSQGLKLFGEIKDRLREPDDETYAKLSNIAMIAGMAISHTGTSLPHGLSYSVTYELGVPHGRAVGIFLAGYVELYKDKSDTTKVLELLGFSSYDKLKVYLEALLGKVDVPKELSVRNVELLYANKAKLKNYPFDITKEEMLKLLS